MTYRPFSSINSSGLSDSRTNNSGITIQKGTPVRVNASGLLDFIDVSVEAQALGIIGVASQSIADNSQGQVTNSGKIESITTTAAFGDVLFVSKTGTLTNVKPSLGVDGFVSGDFVIMVGVVAKNESNPLVKDLVLSISVVGQL